MALCEACTSAFDGPACPYCGTPEEIDRLSPTAARDLVMPTPVATGEAA